MVFCKMSKMWMTRINVALPFEERADEKRIVLGIIVSSCCRG